MKQAFLEVKHAFWTLQNVGNRSEAIGPSSLFIILKKGKEATRMVQMVRSPVAVCSRTLPRICLSVCSRTLPRICFSFLELYQGFVLSVFFQNISPNACFRYGSVLNVPTTGLFCLSCSCCSRRFARSLLFSASLLACLLLFSLVF